MFLCVFSRCTKRQTAVSLCQVSLLCGAQTCAASEGRHIVSEALRLFVLFSHGLSVFTLTVHCHRLQFHTVTLCPDTTAFTANIYHINAGNMAHHKSKDMYPQGCKPVLSDYLRRSKEFPWELRCIHTWTVFGAASLLARLHSVRFKCEPKKWTTDKLKWKERILANNTL